MEFTVLGRTGLRVSRLGLGGAPFGGAFGPMDDKQAERVVHAAIDLGVTFIDTAAAYGNGESERRIGLALGGGKRDGVVLATKFPNVAAEFGYDETIRSIEASLRRLQTDRIDLIQAHDVERASFDTIMNETLPAMEKARSEGKVAAIGVTGRNLPFLIRLLETNRFDAVQVYSRYTLVDVTAQEELFPLAKRLGVGVINSSVLYSGTLADDPPPFANSRIVGQIRERMEQIRFLRRTDQAGALVEPAMRFSLGHPDIHTTLTGAWTPEAMKTNASFCDGQGLEERDARRIAQLFRGRPLLP